MHVFDVEFATKYGILEAILFNFIGYWTDKNEANNQNFYEGRYWIFNSIKAFNDLFPYASEKKIRNALKHLEEEGIILKGNFNEKNYDRTNWYTITDFGISLSPKGRIDTAKRANGYCQKGEPIPLYTINKENNNINIIIKESKKFTKPTLEEIRNYCDERSNGIDPEYFYDFYESKDWMIGKNKMKDWKSAVRTWEKNRKKEVPTTKPTLERVAEGVYRF